ncbi:MAG: HK97 gp10 family phage protein [Candidatus Aureabacteria bacterium]|nr:HK97 gp10 family phage protein [Candidatus Auribacterota bacterium]
MVELVVTFKSLLTPAQLTKTAKVKIAKALKASALIIERKAKQKCPVDTGFLRASIHSRLMDWNHVRVGSTMAKYAAPVEFGTKPHRPPFAPIKRWAERHGIPEAAYPILLKIQREGTEAQPFLRPALLESEHLIAKLLIKAQREAMADATRK